MVFFLDCRWKSVFLSLLFLYFFIMYTQIYLALAVLFPRLSSHMPTCPHLLQGQFREGHIDGFAAFSIPSQGDVYFVVGDFKHNIMHGHARAICMTTANIGQFGM